MKTWETPKLIVLVRSKAEEAILSACKSYYMFHNSGPLAKLNLCYTNEPVPGMACSTPCTNTTFS